MTQPEFNGPKSDGSRSLAKESKVGIAVQWVLSVLAVGLLDWLSRLDTASFTGWLAGAATLAVPAAIALLTAWLKRNR